MALTNELALARIEQKGAHFIKNSTAAYDDTLVVESTPEHINDFLLFLRDDEHLQFNFLTSLCAVHFPERKGEELEIVYMLHNWVDNYRMRVKVGLPESDPSIPTATNVWITANWMERQEYDFFGINFTGHPNLVRILNVDEMEVFPMRKQYRLEDGTRTDKDDRFFGRDGNFDQTFD